MKRFNSLVIITIALIVLFATGCGGGGVSGITPNITNPTVAPPTPEPTPGDPTPEPGKGLVVVQVPLASGAIDASATTTTFTATKIEDIFNVSLLSSVSDVNVYKDDFTATQATTNLEGKAFFQLDPGNYLFSTVYGSECLISYLSVEAGQTYFEYGDIYNYTTLNITIKPKWSTTFESIQDFERYFVKIYDPVAQKTILIPLLRQDNYDNKKWYQNIKIPKAEYQASAYMLDRFGNKINTDLNQVWNLTFSNINTQSYEIYDYELGYTMPENINSANVAHPAGELSTLIGEEVWALINPEIAKACIWDSYQGGLPYWYASLATGYWASKQTTVYTGTTDDSIVMTSEVIEKNNSYWSYRDIRGKDFQTGSKQNIPIVFLASTGKEFRFRDFVQAGRTNIGIQSKNVGKIVNIKVQSF